MHNTLVENGCCQEKGRQHLQFMTWAALVAEVGRQMPVWIWDHTRCCALLSLPWTPSKAQDLDIKEATTREGQKEEIQQGGRKGGVLLHWGSPSKPSIHREAAGAECFEGTWEAYWQSMLPVLRREKPHSGKRWQPWSLVSWKRPSVSPKVFPGLWKHSRQKRNCKMWRLHIPPHMCIHTYIYSILQHIENSVNMSPSENLLYKFCYENKC